MLANWLYQWRDKHLIPLIIGSSFTTWSKVLPIKVRFSHLIQKWEDRGAIFLDVCISQRELPGSQERYSKVIKVTKCQFSLQKYLCTFQDQKVSTITLKYMFSEKRVERNLFPYFQQGELRLSFLICIFLISGVTKEQVRGSGVHWERY